MTLDRRTRRYIGGASLLAAGAVAGGILAGSLSASAASGTSSTSGAPTSGTPAAGTATPPPNAKSSTPVRTDEKSVSSSTAATIRQKALAAVPGGTIYRIETDAGDGAYEAHMTKADGTLVTVKFDKNLNVTHVEAGMGKGDPGGMRGPGGPHGGPPPNGSTNGSTNGTGYSTNA